MADWAYERSTKVRDIIDKAYNRQIRSCVVNEFAQAFRDIQRETAEECLRIVKGKDSIDAEFGGDGSVDSISDAIRDRFGLKENL